MNQKRFDTKKLVLLAVLSAIAYIAVFLFRIPVVSFLKYEPKDVIITIGAFLFGPLEGLIMSVVVSLIEMVTISSTGPIGLLMNVISTAAFTVTASAIYGRRRSMGGAVGGLALGSVAMVAVMLLWNYLITPLYMGVSREDIVGMLLPVFLPFNLLKAGLNSALILILYKPFFSFLHKNRFYVQENAPVESKKTTAGVIIFAAFVLVTCIYLVLVFQGIL